MGGGTGAGASGSGRELFRSGRAFAAGDPGDLAGAAGFPDRGSVTGDLRDSNRPGAGRSGRDSYERGTAARGAAAEASGAAEKSAVVVCTAAALVPGSDGAGKCRL